jgi:uncharacterized protein (DUF983 family)
LKFCCDNHFHATNSSSVHFRFEIGTLCIIMLGMGLMMLGTIPLSVHLLVSLATVLSTCLLV